MKLAITAILLAVPLFAFGAQAQSGFDPSRCDERAYRFFNKSQCKADSNNSAASSDNQLFDRVISFRDFRDSDLLGRYSDIEDGDVYTKITSNNLRIPKEFDCRESSFLGSIVRDFFSYEETKEIIVVLSINEGGKDFQSSTKGFVTELARITKSRGGNCTASSEVREKAVLARVRADTATDLSIYVGLIASTEIGYDISSVVSETANILGGNMVGNLAAAAPLIGPIITNNSTSTSKFGTEQLLNAYPPQDDRQGFDVTLQLNETQTASFEIRQEVDPYHLIASVNDFEAAASRAAMRYLEIRNGSQVVVNEDLLDRLRKDQAMPDFSAIGNDLALLNSACGKVSSVMNKYQYSNRSAEKMLAMMMVKFDADQLLRSDLGKNVCLSNGNREEYDALVEPRKFFGCPITADTDIYISKRVGEIRTGLDQDKFSVGPFFPEDLPDDAEAALTDVLGLSRPFKRKTSCYRSLGGPNSGDITTTPFCTYTFKVNRLGGAKEPNWVVFQTSHDNGGKVDIEFVELFSDPSNYSSIPDSRTGRCAWPNL